MLSDLGLAVALPFAVRIFGAARAGAAGLGAWAGWLLPFLLPEVLA